MINKRYHGKCCRAGFLSIILCLVSVFNFYSVYAAEITPEDNQNAIMVAVSEFDSAALDRIMYQAFKQMGIDAKITSLGMTNAINMANSGRAAVLGAYPEGLEAKYPNLVRADAPFGSVEVNAYQRKGFTHKVADWDDLKGQVVGYLYQRHFLDENVPPTVKRAIKFQDNEDLVKALQNGEIEIALLPESPTTSESLKHHLPEGTQLSGTIGPFNVYVYFNKDFEILRGQFSDSLAEMQSSGTFNKILQGQYKRSDTEGHTNILYINTFGDSKQSNAVVANILKESFGGSDDIDLNQYDFYPNPGQDLSTSIITTNNFMRSKFASGLPDLIVVSGNYAFSYIRAVYQSTYMGTPVVFCSVSQDMLKEIEPFEKYFTGIANNLSVDDTVDGITKIFPDTKNLYVLNDDSITGNATKKIIEEMFETNSHSLNVKYNQSTDMNVIVEDIENLPENSAILIGEFYVDSSFDMYGESKVSETISKHTDLPIFGLLGCYAGNGQLGGKYCLAENQGVVATDYSQKILEGESPQNLPVINSPEQNKWIFSHSKMKEYGLMNDGFIKASGAEIIEVPQTLKSINPTSYKILVTSIVIGSLLLLSLFALVYFLTRKNKLLRESQKNLHTTEELLEKERVIKSAKIRTSRIMSVAPVMYVFTQNDIVQESNEFTQETIGAFPGDDIKKFYFDLDERKRLLKMLETSDAITDEVIQLILKDGQINRFIVTIAKYKSDEETGYFLWGSNIEKSERQKDFLTRSQTDMNNLIESIPIPLFIFEPASTAIVYANSSFLNTFGLSKEDVDDGLSAFATLPETQPDGTNSLQMITEYIDHILTSDKPIAAEFTGIRTNGETLSLRAMCSTFLYRGIFSIISIAQDISAEQEQQKLMQKIVENEKEANLLKSRFIVNMSHEIRTPMNAIIGLSEIELQRAKDKDSFNVFRKINSSAKNLLGIVNDILDFSKIEAEDLVIEDSNFVFEEMLSDVLQVTSQRINDGIRVEMLADIDGNIPVTVCSDRTRVWQILKNVLDNSVKYTREGFIILSAKFGGLDQEGDILIDFGIKDTGVGMSQQQLERIYIPFEQFHENKLNFHGTGLGMAITNQLISMLDGSIHIESELNVGTTVRISLPFNTIENTSTLSESLKATNLEGKTVLVVDDSPYVCDSLDAFFNSLGMVPTCVQDSDTALSVIEAKMSSGSGFDIMVIDYLLENETGISLAEKIKGKLSETPKMVMITAYSRKLIQSEVDNAGFLTVVDKPFVPSKLVEAISDALNVVYEQSKEDEKIQFPNAKVLLCEDNFINQDVAMGMLEIFGIEPMIAENGEEALQFLNDGEMFDLILMDILMPKMDGHQATVAIRQSGKPYRDIPIVAMTANAMNDEVAKCYDEGMNGHISKPIDVDVLYDELKKYLMHRAERVSQDSYQGTSDSGEAIEIRIDGIDTEDGMKRFANKTDKYEKALRSFALEIEKTVPYISELMEQDDVKEARNQVHKLKGIAGNLGAAKMFESAGTFELALTDGQADTFLFGKFKKTSQTILESLNRYFSTNSGRMKSKEELVAGEKDEAISLLLALKHSLDQYNPNESERISEMLLAKDWSGIDRDSIDLINEDIENYLYEEAAAKIDGLLEVTDNE